MKRQTGVGINEQLETTGSGGGGTVNNDGTFATPGKQDTGNASLASIDTKLTAPLSVVPVPDTTNGWLVAMMTSADGSTALTNAAQAIKASAGKLGGWYIYNPNSAATYVLIYNVAAASVTVGTTNPQMCLCIPATSAANIEFTLGIPFTNAGFSAAAATTGPGNTAPAIALEANFMYK